MEKNKTQCPKCLELGEIMEAKPIRGFEYKKCNLCQGEGTVTQELADDYVFSLNEDLLESNENW